MNVILLIHIIKFHFNQSWSHYKIDYKTDNVISSILSHYKGMNWNIWEALLCKSFLHSSNLLFYETAFKGFHL